MQPTKILNQSKRRRDELRCDGLGDPAGGGHGEAHLDGPQMHRGSAETSVRRAQSGNSFFSRAINKSLKLIVAAVKNSPAAPKPRTRSLGVTGSDPPPTALLSPLMATRTTWQRNRTREKGTKSERGRMEFRNAEKPSSMPRRFLYFCSACFSH